LLHNVYLGDELEGQRLKRFREEKRKQIEKSKKILAAYSRISVEKLCSYLNLSQPQFDEKILDWAV